MSVTTKNPFANPPMAGATTVSPGEAQQPVQQQVQQTFDPLAGAQQPALQPTPFPSTAESAGNGTIAVVPQQQAPVPPAPSGNPFAGAVAPGPGALPGASTANPFGVPGADDSFDFDLTNVQSSNLIAAGYYIAYVGDIEKGTSRKGNPMWTWSFIIIADGNSQPTNYAGKTSKLFTALTDEALFKLAETVESLGLGGSGKPLSFKKADAVHRLAIIEIEEGEFEGRKNSSLRRVYPYSGPGGIGAKYQVGAMSPMGAAAQ